MAAPIVHLLGCTDDGGAGDGIASDTGTDGDTSDSSGDTETGDTTDGTGTSDAGTESDTEGTTTDTSSECGGAADAWAMGGTAAMVSKACYPDPFEEYENACLLICETTEGPCTADTAVREDISDGWTGLPVRLCLRFVYEDTCEPIEGASIEIWHTQRTGVYSGVTPSGSFCYGDDADAENYLYFRGTQVTDDDGRVYFDTCYPGWYSSRAVHIHFRVWPEGLEGSVYTTSQLFFTDELNEEIFDSHPEYSEFGQPDTVNTTDNVIGGEEDMTPYLLDTERMTDGVMLAWKQIGLRSADGEACQAEGAGGGGGGGGEGGGEPPP
ncbi:protocatechuate 3,4-dioxygenase [Pseudenhygromyxa sp. WMMC2535]|uniref:dioxygenase family protein n=1 Tax=Pseudenhygromyxa sp. WMMC2535 TaxID=2712867 RepID=UPI0031F848A6